MAEEKKGQNYFRRGVIETHATWCSCEAEIRRDDMDRDLRSEFTSGSQPTGVSFSLFGA